MKIALLGHGTVGQGVDRIISERVGGVEVARILELPDRLTDPRMTSSFEDIANDPEIALVVECMGGLEPAHGFILRALAAGKSVVTSNKAVVAAYFREFAAAAAAGGAGLFIEATCGGGIPWIASIRKVRRIDDVRSFSGIMNGTTNYIVDAMSKNGADFDETLLRAQELGYAERDPSADIDGIDVKNKTIIAVGVAFDAACTAELPVTGIRNLTRVDLERFRAHGRTVKLLGRGVQGDGRYAAVVEPVALSRHTLEANVPANFNLMSLDATTVGPLKFYGRGAGMLPTGNAMVQDVLDATAGVRPTYDLSRGLAWDPSLLTGDYVFRTMASVPHAGAWEGDEGSKIVRGVTAVEARSLFERACESDPSTFMAALAKEGL